MYVYLMYLIDVPRLFCCYHRRVLSAVAAVICRERNALISISIGCIIILRQTCVYINIALLHNYVMFICIDKAVNNVKDADLSV